MKFSPVRDAEVEEDTAGRLRSTSPSTQRKRQRQGTVAADLKEKLASSASKRDEPQVGHGSSFLSLQVEAAVENSELERLEEQLEWASVTSEGPSSLSNTLTAIERLVSERPDGLVTPREGLALLRAVWQGIMARTSCTRDWRTRARAMRLLSAVLPVDDRSHVNLRGSHACEGRWWYWLQLARRNEYAMVAHSNQAPRIILSGNAASPDADAAEASSAATTSRRANKVANTPKVVSSSGSRTRLGPEVELGSELERPVEAQISIGPRSLSTFWSLLRLLATGASIDESQALQLYRAFLVHEGTENDDDKVDTFRRRCVRTWCVASKSLIQTYGWTEACAMGALDPALCLHLEMDPLFRVLLLLRMWMFSLRFDSPSWSELQELIWSQLGTILEPRSLFVLRHIRFDEEYRWMPWKRQGCPRFERMPRETHDDQVDNSVHACASNDEKHFPHLSWLNHDVDSTGSTGSLAGSVQGLKHARVEHATPFLDAASETWFLCRYTREYHLEWLLDATDQPLALDTFLRRRLTERATAS
ncbi:hypothetical protein F1559_004805 [Cyanidiococcus yangmingshanensis]|uniref:Uncharacterized protein n=1 Tax=Cyanidiococcus yangmingshanensis TaxID=2690220 RepID=A0A7J7INK5_9RHOD|nr:hypothetical protein F1559_004805 [Cyanidiococcus yangmingshanensis]